MRCAIIGLACLFPGAPDLQTFWRNIEEGVDAISDVPTGRWDKQFYDPNSTSVDRFYCRRGGFVDSYADFDPLEFGVVPKSAASIEPDQLLTLKIGFEALRDAGYAKKRFAREKTGVVLGRGNYIGAGVLHLEQHVRLLPQILATLQDLFPDLSRDALDAARTALKNQFSYYGPDAAAGMIPNLLASRLANRLDLRGPAYTIDAACASSLIAVEQACNALASGEMDMMLAGGVHLTHDLTFWATFCQLGALSRAGVARPFSRQADGILAGEGVGVAVLKRLDDALACGDRVYAVIEGHGSSSDGSSGSLVSPAAAGQLQALEKAWCRARISRNSIGLLEAHGTGTPAGDSVEIETLRAFFGGAPAEGARPVLGSVKSMIGHAMPASGMASLIKSALAIYHGVLPPTLHCEDPNPSLHETRFRVIGQAEKWAAPVQARVAAVNAFGFGGINAHVVLRGVEAAPVAGSVVQSRNFRSRIEHVCTGERKLPEVLLLAGATPSEILARLDAGPPYAQQGEGPCRLAVIAPDAARIATARRAVAAAKPWSGRQNVYFSPNGLIASGGKLAFVFPGVGSTFKPQAEDLPDVFGAPLLPNCEALDPAVALPRVVSGLLGFNAYLFDRLGELGLRADGFAGHSIGEWSAMFASGMIRQPIASLLGRGLDLDTVEFPDALFLSASCSAADMQAFLQGIEDAALSHDNCPHQVIACGTRPAIGLLGTRLRDARVLHQILPIVSGFHSPLFASHMQRYEEFYGACSLAEPGAPVWSATSASPFPLLEEEKRRLTLKHLLEPVRFREMIEAMHADNFRVFVEVGTGSLKNFIGDTLSGKPHLAIESNREDRTGLAQLQHMSAALWVEGAAFDTCFLQPANAPHAAETQAQSRPKNTMRLSLGVPLVRVPKPLDRSLLPSALSAAPITLPAANSNDPLHSLLRATLDDIDRAGREVLAVWQAHRHRAAPPPALLAKNFSVRTQKYLDVGSTAPFLKDHALYPQAEGWPIMADCRPVVPLTMEALLVREAFEAARPDLKVIEIRNIQAYKWLDVSEPLTIDITLDARDEGLVDAEIEGFFRAQLVVAADYPPPLPQHVTPLVDSRDTETDARGLYEDRWMFHGPAYRGVERFSGIGENGIDGVLRVTAGQGALLDNMGQLAGYWVMEQPENCLAMPIGVGKIKFFTPDLASGAQAFAQVRITRLDALNCVSNIFLQDSAGRPCIEIDGWHTRRYVMDRAFATQTRYPARRAVSREVTENVFLFEDVYDTAMVRDYISRTYLTASERAQYDALPPRRRRAWLAGRVAAKDAVLAWLRRSDKALVYPQEFLIQNDAVGMPVVIPHVSNSVPADLRISITHKGRFAAAVVGITPVGVDIERIEPRDAGFLALAFTPAERALFDENDAVSATRFWVAKEVAAKQAGTGLLGRPGDFVIDAHSDDMVHVNGLWVRTRRLEDYILGWTDETPKNQEFFGSFLQKRTSSLS